MKAMEHRAGHPVRHDSSTISGPRLQMDKRSRYNARGGDTEARIHTQF
jgi:hypothetical protein